MLYFDDNFETKIIRLHNISLKRIYRSTEGGNTEVLSTSSQGINLVVEFIF